MPTIRRGTVRSYAGGTHRASVQIAGSLAVWLDAVPVATNIPAADVLAGRECSVLFFDPSNPNDAVIITVHGTTWAGVLSDPTGLPRLTITTDGSIQLDPTGSPLGGINVIDILGNITVPANDLYYTFLNTATAITNNARTGTSLFGLRFLAALSGGEFLEANAIDATLIASGSSPKIAGVARGLKISKVYVVAPAGGSQTIVGVDIEDLAATTIANVFGARIGQPASGGTRRVGLFIDNAAIPGLPTLTGAFALICENVNPSVLAGPLTIGANAAPTAGFSLDLRTNPLRVAAGASRMIGQLLIGADAAPPAGYALELRNRLLESVPSTAPSDANIGNSQMTAWLNETNNKLTFRVRYSDGTLKTGTLNLA